MNFEQELKEAWQRNTDRNRRARRSNLDFRYLELNKAEAATLALQQRLDLQRYIKPQHMRYKVWMCPYGRIGDLVWIREPVLWWGKDQDHATYLYADDPRWASAGDSDGWRAATAAMMPAQARRHRVVINNVSRPADERVWLISVQIA